MILPTAGGPKKPHPDAKKSQIQTTKTQVGKYSASDPPEPAVTSNLPLCVPTDKPRPQVLLWSIPLFVRCPYLNLQLQFEGNLPNIT